MNESCEQKFRTKAVKKITQQNMSAECISKQLRTTVVNKSFEQIMKKIANTGCEQKL